VQVVNPEGYTKKEEKTGTIQIEEWIEKIKTGSPEA